MYYHSRSVRPAVYLPSQISQLANGWTNFRNLRLEVLTALLLQIQDQKTNDAFHGLLTFQTKDVWFFETSVTVYDISLRGVMLQKTDVDGFSFVYIGKIY
jgi:hypothetical protein